MQRLVRFISLSWTVVLPGEFRKHKVAAALSIPSGSHVVCLYAPGVTFDPSSVRENADCNVTVMVCNASYIIKSSHSPNWRVCKESLPPWCIQCIHVCYRETSCWGVCEEGLFAFFYGQVLVLYSYTRYNQTCIMDIFYFSLKMTASHAHLWCHVTHSEACSRHVPASFHKNVSVVFINCPRCVWTLPLGSAVSALV